MITRLWLLTLLLCRLVAGITTTSTVVLTNGVGEVITQLTVINDATLTNTGTSSTTSITSATTAATTPTTTGTSSSTSTGTGLTKSSSGSSTSSTTTPGVVATTSSLSSSSSSSSVSSSVSSSLPSSSTTSGSGSAVSTSSVSTTSSVTKAAGTNPDPSTDFTEPPVTAVTTLSMDTLITITEGTTKTYTSSREETSNLWVTVVRQGHTLTVQTTFAQRFASMYSQQATPTSGSMGLGTISGTIGVVKSELQETIKLGNAERAFSPAVLPLASVFAFLVYLF